MKRPVRNILAVVFVVVGIGLAFVAYLWFSGRLDSGHQRQVTLMFGDVTGLRVGDPAQIQGVAVGKVLQLTLSGDKVKCVPRLDRSIVPTEDTKFTIQSVSYLSSDRYITVVLGTGAEGREGLCVCRHEPADEPGRDVSQVEQSPGGLSSRGTGQASRGSGPGLVKDLSSQLSQLGAGITEQLGHFSGGLDEFKATFTGTAAQLNRLGGTLDSLRGIMGGSSTAGKLLQTDELYQEIRKTNEQIQTLVEDVKKNPGRYVTVRIF